MSELQAADPTLGTYDLYAAGLRIGRDHVASTVNTLVLAYAGASLPLLLLFSQGGRSVTGVLTTETVAVEVVRAIVGSIGLIAAVPITTGLAAWVVHRPVTSIDGDDDDVRAVPQPQRLRGPGSAEPEAEADDLFTEDLWADAGPGDEEFWDRS